MSIISRISTFSLHQNTIGNFNRVFNDLATLQKQISSGVKASTFSEMPTQVEQFTDLTGEISKLKNYEDSLTLTTSRFSSVGTSLSNMIDIVDNMENLITLRRNGAIGTDVQFATQMDGYRKSLSGELNTTFGGRYLFSGTKNNVAPVIDDPSIPNTVTPGVPDDGYYQGSKQNIIVRAQDNQELEMDVRADNPAFQKIFAAISQSLQGDADNNDTTIASSLDLLQSGLHELIGMKTRNDAKVVNLKDTTDRHSTYRTYLQGVSDDVLKTDVVSASTKVALDQTILSATFQSYSRISSLSLVNYLQ